MNNPLFALCGHCGFERLGLASVNDQYLCHPDYGMNCYRLVTVYDHPMPCECCNNAKTGNGKKSWDMWAVFKNGMFLHTDNRKEYVRLYRHGDPIQVKVTVNPEGTYFGWIDYNYVFYLDYPFAYEPRIIQPTLDLFNMQFTHGHEQNELKGAGRVVRLNVEVVNPEDIS